MKNLKYIAVFLLLVLVAGCGQSPKKDTPPPPSGDGSVPSGPPEGDEYVGCVPEIGDISIITDGNSTAVLPGHTYLCQGEHSFEVRVSKNVTSVEFVFHPDEDEENYVILYPGVAAAEGVYSISLPEIGPGTGYFIAYNLADGDNYARRTEKITIASSN